MQSLPIIRVLMTIAVWAAVHGACAADDELRVLVRSGRTLIGTLDARTDEAELWIRTDREGVTIARPIAWSSVVELARAGTATSREPLLAEAARLRAADGGASPQTALTRPAAPARGSLQLWQPAAGARPAPPAPQLQWIEVDGYLANWDADVEADGLLMELEVFDRFGAPAPVAGTLQVELIGETVPPYSRGNAPPVLARWTRQVRPDDFSGGTLRMPLELQSVHPDFDRIHGRFALIHARLLVPGQAALEASRDAVALQGFSPVRERLEQAFDARFLPTEATGRSRRESAIGAW